MEEKMANITEKVEEIDKKTNHFWKDKGKFWKPFMIYKRKNDEKHENTTSYFIGTFFDSDCNRLGSIYLNCYKRSACGSTEKSANM